MCVESETCYKKYHEKKMNKHKLRPFICQCLIFILPTYECPCPLCFNGLSNVCMSETVLEAKRKYYSCKSGITPRPHKTWRCFYFWFRSQVGPTRFSLVGLTKIKAYEYFLFTESSPVLKKILAWVCYHMKDFLYNCIICELRICLISKSWEWKDH